MINFYSTLTGSKIPTDGSFTLGKEKYCFCVIEMHEYTR